MGAGRPGAGAAAARPAAAYGYVALAAKLQSLVDPVQQAWRQSVDDARREREEQVARTAGA